MYGELHAKRDALESLWRQGLSGRGLLQRHSRLIDDYVSQCFLGCPEAGEGMALLALGGYGRGELFPFSDIDLMLLYEPAAENRLSAVTEAVFYPLWDAGLEVGHGVRTPDACFADAQEDFFFQVALLDARLLAGSEKLFTDLRATFRKGFVEGHRRDFLQKMLHFRAERHKRFGMHSYQLEPHIKESPGGMRDIQAMLWTAEVVFGLRGLNDMEESGLLTSQERRDFEDAWDFLIRVRNRLHYISGRKNDQLYFEHQEDMAQAFKYRSANGLLGVENFMRAVYGHLQTVATTTDLFFEHVDETIGLTQRKSVEQTLEPGIAVRKGRLHFTDQALLKKKPSLLMRIFTHAAKTGVPIHHRASKIVSANLELIDDKLRQSRRMAKAFLDALQEAQDPVYVLSAMLDTGLMSAYIPEFKDLESLAQHDIYHVYTVDRHLLQTVAELKRLHREEPLFMNVASPAILYLAALFHDIGKGHREDHCKRGARLVRDIGQRLGLADADIACLSFLIRHHLFLIMAAMRRDLEDEQFILQCAERIKDPDRLLMLYLLTIADSRATGPTVWNDWKAALLLELYLKISHLLDRPEHDLPNRAQGIEWMRSQIRQQLDEEAATIDLETLPEDYLLNFSPVTVAEHLRLRKELNKRKLIITHEDHGSFWSILFMARDSTGLLAKICGALALHNLNVVEAQIHTWPDATAVDVINVRSAIDSSYAGQDWKALERDLNLALANRFGLTHRLVNKYRHSYSAKQQQALRPDPRVVIDNEASDMYTIIEVYAEDQPGLLYDITRTLAEFGINIYRAKIGVERDHVVDVFYALDPGGGKINEPSFQNEIQEALLIIAASGSSHKISAI